MQPTLMGCGSYPEKIPGCYCHTCSQGVQQTSGWPLFQRMIVCPTCGNKRCPKATYHGHACTGSNDLGQPGSRYGENL